MVQELYGISELFVRRRAQRNVSHINSHSYIIENEKKKKNRNFNEQT